MTRSVNTPHTLTKTHTSTIGGGKRSQAHLWEQKKKKRERERERETRLNQARQHTHARTPNTHTHGPNCRSRIDGKIKLYLVAPRAKPQLRGQHSKQLEVISLVLFLFSFFLFVSTTWRWLLSSSSSRRLFFFHPLLLSFLFFFFFNLLLLLLLWWGAQSDKNRVKNRGVWCCASGQQGGVLYPRQLDHENINNLSCRGRKKRDVYKFIYSSQKKRRRRRKRKGLKEVASKGRKTEDVAAAAARTGSADGTARLSSYNLKKQNKRTLFPPFISQKKIVLLQRE